MVKENKTTEVTTKKKGPGLKARFRKAAFMAATAIAAIAPAEKAEAANGGYGAGGSFGLGNVVQFQEGRTVAQAESEIAALRYVAREQGGRVVSTDAKNIYLRDLHAANTSYTRAKRDYMYRFQQARRQNDVPAMVECYGNMVQAARSYVSSYSSATSNFGYNLVNVLNNNAYSQLTFQSDSEYVQQRGRDMKMSALDSFGAGIGMGDTFKNGYYAVGAGMSGGDFLGALGSAGDHQRAAMLNAQGGSTAHQQAVAGQSIATDLTNDIGNRYKIVRSDLAGMEKILDMKVKSADRRCPGLLVRYENYKDEGFLQAEALYTTQQMEGLAARSQENANWTAVRARENAYNAQRNASGTLKRSVDNIGAVGRAFKSMFGR